MERNDGALSTVYMYPDRVEEAPPVDHEPRFFSSEGSLEGAFHEAPLTEGHQVYSVMPPEGHQVYSLMPPRGMQNDEESDSSMPSLLSDSESEADEEENEHEYTTTSNYATGLKQSPVEDRRFDDITLMQLQEPLDVPIGKDTPDEVREALQEQSNKAKADGLQDVAPLTSLLDEFQDVFRIKLGSDPPATTKPLKLEPLPGTVPYRGKARRAPKEYRDFLRQHVLSLLKHNLVYANPNSKFASEAFVVPKPGGRGLRMVVDMRRVNSQMTKYTWPMPQIEVIEQYLENSKVYGIIDLFKGYWQAAVAGELEMQSFITDMGVFTPRRLLMGNTNSVGSFQASMSECLGPLLYECCLLWIDDILIFSRSLEEHWLNCRKVLERLREYGFFASAVRCNLYQKEAKFCGKIYSAAGISHDPERIQALTTMQEPVQGADLYQFLSAVNWMRQSLPNFERLVLPLREVLNEVLSRHPKRNKRQAKKVPLKEAGWTAETSKHFQCLIEALKNIVTLAYPRDDFDMCVFTDANDYTWSSMVTQVPPEDAHKPIAERAHEPLAFLSGAFKGAALRWSVIEKEATPEIKNRGTPRLHAYSRAWLHILCGSQEFGVYFQAQL